MKKFLVVLSLLISTSVFATTTMPFASLICTGQTPEGHAVLELWEPQDDLVTTLGDREVGSMSINVIRDNSEIVEKLKEKVLHAVLIGESITGGTRILGPEQYLMIKDQSYNARFTFEVIGEDFKLSCWNFNF